MGIPPTELKEKTTGIPHTGTLTENPRAFYLQELSRELTNPDPDLNYRFLTVFVTREARRKSLFHPSELYSQSLQTQTQTQTETQVQT